jgi:ABC-type transporter Mla subunit MlaD
MKKNASDYFVALSVIACSLALLAALTYALGGWKPASNGRSLEVDFADVTGVKLHSEVRYAGAPAGTVSAIRLLSEKERLALPAEKRRNAVRVSVQLADDLAPLPGDVAVSISSDTLLSDKFIAPAVPPMRRDSRTALCCKATAEATSTNSSIPSARFSTKRRRPSPGSSRF